MGGTRITCTARRFLDSWWWEHDDDGQVLPGGPYTHCRVTTATPTGEDQP